MLNIVLLIIKIIGILLAVLVGLLLIALFVPMKYIGKGDFHEDNKVVLTASSLFWLVRAKLHYDNGDAKLCIRVLGIPFIRRNLLDDDSKEDNDEDYKANQKKDKEFNKKKTNNTLNKSMDSTVNESNLQMEDEESYGKEHIWNDFYSGEKEDLSVDENDGLSFGIDIRGRFDLVFKKIKEGWTFAGKIKNKLSGLRKLFKSKGGKLAFASTKETVVKLARHMKPKQLEGKLVFGFDRPDITGQILAVLSIIYGIINVDTDRFEIEPDFEKKVIEGSFFFKGNFVLGYVLIHIIKLHNKREIKYVIKQLKSINAL